MPPPTTQATARAQLLGHFTETLRILPAESALALRHPDLPVAGFHHGVTLPFDEDDPDSVLEFFDISYWVIGATPTNSDQYFDLMIRAWRDHGWTTRTDRNTRPRTGYARTFAGYGLTVTQSVNGYLSMSGSTPPFASDSVEGSPLPPQIDRPSEPPN
ncbi:hypothetical protein AB0C34_27980 [Nocardia sp. NPDC049220]|uniref:hypothetical protein n=1 Tax=Nocardia sp. NPDC049220 TaxID=3155273 RepID=UPI0033CCDBDB